MKKLAILILLVLTCLIPLGTTSSVAEASVYGQRKVPRKKDPAGPPVVKDKKPAPPPPPKRQQPNRY